MSFPTTLHIYTYKPHTRPIKELIIPLKPRKFLLLEQKFCCFSEN